jgi:hypothetical protein
VIRGDNPVLHDEMTIETLRVSASNTVYYRAEVTQGDGQVNEYAFSDISSASEIELKGGVLKVPVRERDDSGFKLELINDLPFPSYWQYGQWTVDITVHEGS